MHKCERWVDKTENGHTWQVRCGLSAVERYVPLGAEEYGWWACAEHLASIRSIQHANREVTR